MGVTIPTFENTGMNMFFYFFIHLLLIQILMSSLDHLRESDFYLSNNEDLLRLFDSGGKYFLLCNSEKYSKVQNKLELVKTASRESS